MTEPAVQLAPTPKKPKRSTVLLAGLAVRNLEARANRVLNRIGAWDLRKADAMAAKSLQDDIKRVRAAIADLGETLKTMDGVKFVARVTQQSLKLSQYKPGDPVKLRDPSDWLEIYTEEELANMVIDRVAQRAGWVFLRTGTRQVGMVPVDLLG